MVQSLVVGALCWGAFIRFEGLTVWEALIGVLGGSVLYVITMMLHDRIDEKAKKEWGR